MAIGTIQDGDVRWLIKDTRSTAIAANPDRGIVGEDGLMSHQDKAKLDKILLNGDIISTYNMPPAGNNLGAVKSGGIFTINNGVISINHASKDGFGDVKVGTNIDVNVGVISVTTASKNDLGVVKIGNRIDVDSDGVISVPDVHMYSGTSATSTIYSSYPSTDNSNTYIRIVNGSSASGVKLKGSGFTSISSSNDTITIDTNYSDMIGSSSTDDGRNGLVPKPLKQDRTKFLRGSGQWYQFKLAYPKQNTRIEYDGFNHTPSWDNYDAAVMTMETVSSSYYATAQIKNITDVNLAFSALSGTSAGRYAVKFTPKDPYVWESTNDASPHYTYWTIEKKANIIYADKTTDELEYLETSDIYIETEAYRLAKQNSLPNADSYNTVAVAEPSFTVPSDYKKIYFEFDHLHGYNYTRLLKDSSNKYYLHHERYHVARGLTNKKYATIQSKIDETKISLTSSETPNFKPYTQVITYTWKRSQKILQFNDPNDANILFENLNPKVVQLNYDYAWIRSPTVSNDAVQCMELVDFCKQISVNSAYNKGSIYASELDNKTSLYSSSYGFYYIKGNSSDTLDNDIEFLDYNGTLIKQGDYVLMINNKYFTFMSDYNQQYLTRPNTPMNRHSPTPDSLQATQVKSLTNVSVSSAASTTMYRCLSATLIIIPLVSSGTCTIEERTGGKPSFYRMYSSNENILKINVTIDATAAKDLAPNANNASIQSIKDDFHNINMTTQQLKNKYKIGDYISFYFAKDLLFDSGADYSIKGTTSTNADVLLEYPKYKAVLVGIRHAENKKVRVNNQEYLTEGVIDPDNGLLSDPQAHACAHFCICKDANDNPICFYAKKLANDKSNNYGWKRTELRQWLNCYTSETSTLPSPTPSPTVTGFFYALPEGLRNNISHYRKFTYHYTSGIPNITDLTSDDYIWLASARELQTYKGHINYMSSLEANACDIYEYIKNGNGLISVYPHNGDQVYHTHWSRSHYCNKDGSKANISTHRMFERGNGTNGAQPTYNKCGFIPFFAL